MDHSKPIDLEMAFGLFSNPEGLQERLRSFGEAELLERLLKDDIVAKMGQLYESNPQQVGAMIEFIKKDEYLVMIVCQTLENYLRVLSIPHKNRYSYPLSAELYDFCKGLLTENAKGKFETFLKEAIDRNLAVGAFVDCFLEPLMTGTSLNHGLALLDCGWTAWLE